MEKVILEADCELPDGRRLRAGQRVSKHVAEQAKALKPATLAVAVQAAPATAHKGGKPWQKKPAPEAADSAATPTN